MLFTGITNSLVGQSHVAPDEIPDDAHPLMGHEHLHGTPSLKAIEGKNMYVTLLNADILIGLVEWVDAEHFTVGQSDPIHYKLIETVREV